MTPVTTQTAQAKPEARRPRGLRSMLIMWPVKLLAFLVPASLVLSLSSMNRGGSGVEEVFSFSFLVMLWASLPCICVSRGIMQFGVEMHSFLAIKPDKLWRLAVRAHAFDLMLVLVAAPALGIVAGSNARLDWPELLLLPLSILALHIMFLAVGAYASIGPMKRPSTRRMHSIMFPYSLTAWGSIVVFCGSLVLIYGLGNSNSLVNAVLAQTATYLLELPVAGPMILFWANPYFLILAIHIDPRFSAVAPLVFIAVCAAITFVLFTRIRKALNVDVDQADERVYDDWLATRQEWQGSQEVGAGSAGAALLHEEPAPAAETAQEGARGEAGGVAQRDVYALPAASAETLLLTEYDVSIREIVTLPRIFNLALLAAACVFFPSLGYTGCFALLGASAFLVYPALPGSPIIPLRAWPIIRWSIQKRILPLLLVDALFLAIYVISTPAVWETYPLMVLCALAARLHLLGFKIAYNQKHVGLLVWMLLPFIAFIIWAMANVGFATQLKPSSQASTLAGVVATLLLNGLPVAWSVWRQHNRLVHYEMERASGQL